MKTFLTPEESTKLIELGVDPKKASMETYSESTNSRGWGGMVMRSKPVFSFTDILEILPEEIDGHPLHIQYDPVLKQWWTGYFTINIEISPELIDSLYHLLSWKLRIWDM